MGLLIKTPLTHIDVERALTRAYPRIQEVLYIDRSPLQGGLSKALRENMKVFFQNKNNGVEEIVLIAKQAPKSAHVIMTTLHKQKGLSSRTPRPLLYKKGVLLYRTLWGDELRHFPFSDRSSEVTSLAKESAEMLAAIHSTPLPKNLAPQARSYTARQENLSTLYKKFPVAMKDFSLIAPAGTLKRPLYLIHGDFQASNILLTLPSGKLGIIDFAAGGTGDSATDVASFLVHTELMLRGVISNIKIRTALDGFEETYKQRVKKIGIDFDVALIAAKFDVLLSILGTTVAHLKPSDKNYKPLITHLNKLFTSL